MTERPPGSGSLPRRLRTHLDATGLLPPGGRVLVALSGGLDSTVLLHLLRFPLIDRGLELSAAHLDHAMRPGSAADAAWVRGLCRAWDVPLRDERLDPPARSEADARERRYAFLRGVAGDALIATAHHLDDQAETVIFRAARGTGIRGLRGIAPRRGTIRRPLLPFRRSALEAYAGRVGLGFRSDPTNRDRSYARNRIRHDVLPALERVHADAAGALARLAGRARAAERAWEAALRRLEAEVVTRSDARSTVLARPVLHSYDPALRARLLRSILRRYGSTPDRAGTRAALEFISSGPSGGELHLQGGARLERDFDEIRVTRAGSAPPDTPLVIPDAGPGSGEAVIGGRVVRVAWGGTAPPGTERVRLRSPAFPLTVRGWEPGDRIRLRYGSKKLKKLFGERRLDRRARHRTPVVADADGGVLWVAGVARAGSVGEDDVGFEIAVEHVEQH